MQRLRAVVKTFKADPVCQALLAAGVDEVFVEEVQGYGRQKGHLGLYRQPAYGIAFLPKIAITAYLPDGLVEAACKAIEEAAATGTIGDGKIFITPVEYALTSTLESGIPLTAAGGAKFGMKKRSRGGAEPAARGKKKAKPPGGGRSKKPRKKM